MQVYLSIKSAYNLPMFPKPTDNPIETLAAWLEEAKAHKAIGEPTAMNIASVSTEGKPSNRMVLLKGLDEHGLVFYTHYSGRKGQELLTNPHAAACFYWQPLGKQIRVEATVEKTSTEESDAYFQSRPRDSRIGAWASRQSEECAGGTKEFLAEVAKKAAKFGVGEIPRPDYWGGFRLVPHTIEFWQEGDFRLHKRLVFTRPTPADSWQTRILYP
jgi:pyridoxamine 5'-phosphate oxidase